MAANCSEIHMMFTSGWWRWLCGVCAAGGGGGGLALPYHQLRSTDHQQLHQLFRSYGHQCEILVLETI